MALACKEYYVSKNLRESVRDLLLLYCWQQIDKITEDGLMDNPQEFTLKCVLGQPHTQQVIHQVNEKKVIKTKFQTTIPQNAKILVYDIDNAYIMLSDQDTVCISKC